MPDFDHVLSSAQSGDGWAFDNLFNEWNRPITAFVRSRGIADVDDVVSEIFLGAFGSIGSFAGDEHEFRAWLYRIARNKITDEYRRSGRRPDTTSLDLNAFEGEGGDVTVEAEARMGATRVDRLLTTLTAEQREVLVLRIVADLTVDQIAEITGRRRGAVKQLQRRALRRLEKQLAAEADTDVETKPYPFGPAER